MQTYWNGNVLIGDGAVWANVLIGDGAVWGGGDLIVVDIGCLLKI